MLVRTTLSTSAVLSLYVERTCRGDKCLLLHVVKKMLVTAVGMSSVVRMGIMGGRGILAGADSQL